MNVTAFTFINALRVDGISILYTETYTVRAYVVK